MTLSNDLLRRFAGLTLSPPHPEPDVQAMAGELLTLRATLEAMAEVGVVPARASEMATAHDGGVETPERETYSIEVFFYGTWEPAPGDDGGWSYDAAIRAAEDGFVGADGEPIDPEKVRVVSDETGEVVW